MGHVRQIPEIRTEAFASNKQEKFGFYEVFGGENTDCLLRKSLRRPPKLPFVQHPLYYAHIRVGHLTEL